MEDTRIEQLWHLPTIDITVRLYKVSEPYEVDEETGTRSYYTTFRNSGADVFNGSGVLIGNMSTILGAGGDYIGFPTEDNEEWLLPPDVLFNALVEALGLQKIYDLEEPKSKKYKGNNDDEEEDDEDLWDRDDRILEAEEEIIENPEGIDWNAGTIRGGYFKDFKQEPLVYKWPNNVGIPRRVRVTITRYIGVGKHYHVSLWEEDNSVWDYEENKWREFWTKWPGKGKTDVDLWDELYTEKAYKNGEFEGYTLRLDVVEALEAVIQKHFPNHEVAWEDYGGDGFDYYRYKHGE